MLTARKPYVADNPMTVLYLHANAPLPQFARALLELQPLLEGLLAKASGGSLCRCRRRLSCHRRGPSRLARADQRHVSSPLLAGADPSRLG